MTEQEFKENAGRYSEYRLLKQKLFFVNGDIKDIDEYAIDKICMGERYINLQKYSDDAKSGLKEYLKTMMLAEIERTKAEMEKI